jgi:hypothetical protein
MNMVMNLQVPQNAGKFLSSCIVGRFQEGLSFMSEWVFNVYNIVMCKVVCMTKKTGSSSDHWIYYHFGYKFS